MIFNNCSLFGKKNVIYHIALILESIDLNSVNRLLKLIYLFIYSFYLKGRETETGRQRRRQNLLSAGLPPKCLKQLRLDQADAKSQEINLDIPHGWHGPNYLIYHLLLSQGMH